MYYFHNDHLGSPWLITNASGGEVQRLNFNAWGRRRDASNWNNYTNLPEMKFDRGFTGHEHLEMFGLINMNARLYDPVLGRFLSPDPLVQVPDFTQSYNGYSYALNNPLSYKDPNGESFILVAAIIGGWIGMGTAMVSSDKSGWGLAGDMFKGLFVGAASGAAGAWAGGAVAGSITSLGFVQGSLSGMAGGFSSGFVGCAGNAWLAGAGFGAAVSGLIGGINGAIQYRKQMTVFTRGVEALGLDGGGEVPATDGFLLDAQKVWYNDAPMESINKFTVEHVPADIQAAMDAGNAPGATRFLHKGGVLTGRSNIYFNKNLAFTSAKQLYYAMGHELLHASQFAALTGQSASLMNQYFIFDGNPVYFNHDLLEFHAYSYQYSLGGAQLNSFSSGLVKAMAKQWPSYFNKLGAINFNWTTNSNYKYPF